MLDQDMETADAGAGNSSARARRVSRRTLDIPSFLYRIVQSDVRFDDRGYLLTQSGAREGIPLNHPEDWELAARLLCCWDLRDRFSVLEIIADRVEGLVHRNPGDADPFRHGLYLGKVPKEAIAHRRWYDWERAKGIYAPLYLNPGLRCVAAKTDGYKPVLKESVPDSVFSS
jgi:hypothetical protein